MSGGLDHYALTQEDVMKLVASQSHLGASNVDFQMEQYIYNRREDGPYIINLRRTWEKIVLAARAIAAIENPADVCVISARQYGQRAVLKFAAHVGATAIVGRFTPGTFTNQIQRAYREPRLLVVTDPRTDHQAITEASYVNIPIICLANTDSPLKYVDIAIPCNNKGAQSIGLMWWFLAREVLMIKGRINRSMGFMIEDKVIMPDLYFYRDPEEVEKEESGGDGQVEEDAKWGQAAGADQFGAPADQWDESKNVAVGGTGMNEIQLTTPVISDWAAETQQWNNQQQGVAAGTEATQQWGGNAASEWN